MAVLSAYVSVRTTYFYSDFHLCKGDKPFYKISYIIQGISCIIHTFTPLQVFNTVSLPIICVIFYNFLGGYIVV